MRFNIRLELKSETIIQTQLKTKKKMQFSPTIYEHVHYVSVGILQILFTYDQD